MKAIKGQIVDLKLYIEGVKIPIKGISLTQQIGAPTTAMISIPPSRGSNDVIPAGAVVHVFFKDKGVWKLLFEGEKIGSNVSVSQNSRYLTLSCVDFTDHWSRTYQYMLNVGVAQSPFEMGDYSCNEDGAWNYSPKTAVTTLESEITKWVFEAENDVVSAINKIFERARESAPFYGYLADKFKLPDKRISSSISDAAKGIFALKFFYENVLNPSLQRLGPYATVLNLLQILLSQIYYITVNIPTVGSLQDNKCLSTFILPQNPFCAPPMCNVLFPDHITTLNYARNDKQEITRLIGRKQSIPLTENTQLNANSVKLTIERFFAPPELNTMIVEGAPVEGDTDFRDSILTNEEKIRGVIADYYDIPFSTEALVDDTSRTLLFSNITMIEYYRRKYAARSLSVSGRFNPNPVQGFACTVIDKDDTYLGYLLSLTHNIQRDGTQSTSYSIGFVRTLPEEQQTIDSDIRYAGYYWNPFASPDWKYDAVGRNIYKEWLYANKDLDDISPDRYALTISTGEAAATTAITAESIVDTSTKLGVMAPPVARGEGIFMSSDYGMRVGGMHRGVDIAGPEKTPLYAPWAGTVSYSAVNENGSLRACGRGLFITHENGVRTLFCHCDARKVDNYATVTQGQWVADMGNTGISTGSHLHIGIEEYDSAAKAWRKVNPNSYFNFAAYYNEDADLPEALDVEDLEDPNSRALVDAITELSAKYFSVAGESSPTVDFADKLTERPIVTEEEYMVKFLGLHRLNEERYSG